MRYKPPTWKSATGWQAFDATSLWSPADRSIYDRYAKTRKRDRRLADMRVKFGRDDAGHPLGKGYPTGRSLRADGQSHRAAWMDILRADPCAYCDSPTSGTVDHIEPSSRPVGGPGGAHSWANFTGACDRCNQRKGARPLVYFLAVRSTSVPRPAMRLA